MIGLNASLVGIQKAEEKLGASASRLAGASTAGSDVDVAQEMVSLSSAKMQLQASAAVARSVSKTIGTLIDTFA